MPIFPAIFSSALFFTNTILFIYLLALGLCCCARASLAVASGGCASLWLTGFSPAGPASVVEVPGLQRVGSAVVACGPPPRPADSSWTRDQTHVDCFG